MEFTDVLSTHVYDFALIFARISAIVAFAPVFGAKNVPNSVKAMIAFTFSIVFTGLLSPLNAEPSSHGAGMVIQLAAEVSIGAAIGFTASLVFEIIIFAGYIMDYMIGFGFINIVDPQSGASISLFAFFYSFLALLLFLLSDSHHILIEIMVRGYDLIPVFSGTINEFSLRHITRLTTAVFYTGFQIAAPIFIIMFMIDFSLGMISKTVPQLQILVVGFPVKIGVGLMAIGMIMKPMAFFLIAIMDNYNETLLWLYKYMGSRQ